MYTGRKVIPMIILGLTVLWSSACKQATQTEAQFIEEKIFDTGMEMEIRVNGLQDLLLFSAQQQLNACQQDCDKLKETVGAAEKEVTAMEDLLFQRIGGIRPPPPPCPCQFGNCLWERLAVFSYFVDAKKYAQLPDVTLQTLNGDLISSSADAQVTYSPEGDQYAVVNLPQKDFKEDAVKMVISTGNEVAEVLVKIK